MHAKEMSCTTKLLPVHHAKKSQGCRGAEAGVMWGGWNCFLKNPFFWPSDMVTLRNHQSTEFSLQESPLFCSDRRKFLFFRWNLEPVTPPSQASLILRESRNGKRKSLSFLAVLALLFVASCLICWQIMNLGDVSSESCHWNGFKVFYFTRKCLLLCLIQMWNARLLYLLSSSRTGMHTAKMWK